jgi:hypothetical protein
LRVRLTKAPAAYLWQLLKAGQLPIIAFFLFESLPTQPKQASIDLALQICTALARCSLCGGFAGRHLVDEAGSPTVSVNDHFVRRLLWFRNSLCCPSLISVV